MVRHAFCIMIPLALGACAEQVGTLGGPQVSAQIVDGTFGAATMGNTLAMTGRADYRMSLARRFDAEVPTMVNFAFNSTALDAEARATLRAQADWIKQFPEVRFKVFGHTDLVGSRAYNRRLGLRRAEAVVLYLTSQGISRSRLDAVVTFGETQPLIATSGRDARNRRTVTEVTGFVETHPGVLNGKYAEIIFREYVASGAPDQTMKVSTQSSTAGAGAGGGGGGS